MRRSVRLTITVAVLAAAASACTGDGEPRKDGTPPPWPLNGLAAAPVEAAVQNGIDIVPGTAPAKVLGVARISDTDVVLAVRDNICLTAFLPVTPAGPTGPAPISFGAQRPALGTGFSDDHEQFPGSALTGPYTVATSPAAPFATATVGCSEKGIALRIEGVDGATQVRKVAGDSLGFRKSGRDVVVTVGTADAIQVVEPGTSSSAAHR
ncbi:hypothetical protein AB0O91_07860 [Kitasatospora sp. NPDC089797]|uniref:hypothetical protein n=1 Tax=Kitasatospora sp. NPDC089797 TaxID=3155298 RepID=UPI00342684BE